MTDPAVVGELPDFVREGMAAEAKERGLDGWVVTLQIPSMVPFMTYSSNRALKEKLWRAYNTRCVGGEFDNSAIVEEIADKRLQLAGLLGYETYADYVLEERMAESSPTVNAFLAELLDRAVEAARRDVETVAGYARAQGFDAELMPWDFGYYSEKLKHERYELSEELTKPYFQLENVRRGMFELANRLYGITLRENPEIPVYHPDVKAYEVFDADGSFLAVLYMDFFPRASKRGGAWMTEFRQQGVENGVETRPLISVVYNFTKPTDSLPSLLTFDEVTTMLHEFGRVARHFRRRNLSELDRNGRLPRFRRIAVADHGELGLREGISRPVRGRLPHGREDARRADPADTRREKLSGRLLAYPAGGLRPLRYGLAQHLRAGEDAGRRFREESDSPGAGTSLRRRTVYLDLVRPYLFGRLCGRVLQQGPRCSRRTLSRCSRRRAFSTVRRPPRSGRTFSPRAEASIR